MSTRSTIAIIESDGSVKGIYCHFDGYLSHNGKILSENYTTEKDVRGLIALGNLSILDIKYNDPPDGHSFNAPVPGYTVAYHRDRGEDYDFLEAATIKDWHGEEYDYFWKVEDKTWYVHTNSKKLILLKTAIRNDNLMYKSLL